jgi:hypothetical protein
VHLDGCVLVCAAYYSARRAGSAGAWVVGSKTPLPVRAHAVGWPASFIQKLDSCCASICVKSGAAIDQSEDRPKRTPLGAVQLRARAERTGSHIGRLCKAMYRQQGELTIRRLLVGSSAGAVARRLVLGLGPRFPSSCPFRICCGSVSSARHIARSVRISRTTRPCTVRHKAYEAYQTGTTAESVCR